MKLIDTHAHLQFKAYDADRDEVSERNSKELAAIINVGAKIDSSEKGFDLAGKVNNFYAAVGVHPHHVNEWQGDWIADLEKLAQKPKVVAIGEIGLDKHEYEGYPKPDLKKQEKILLDQVELANKLDLPILFHCRDAYDDLYNLLKTREDLHGLIHCFMGTVGQAKKFLDLGLYVSFSGNITYKGNYYIRDSAKYVPIDRILVETDSPYLPPEPYRGKRNEPIYVKIVAETVAEVKKSSFEEIAGATSKNAATLLKL
ncbi:MAG: TatD family hydrolase [Candidatus Woykebacteria bacterium]